MSDVVLKYCGCQSKEDLALVANSQATVAGFIFAPSKRRVSPQQVAQWVADVPHEGTMLAGVFVNASEDDIAHVLSFVPLDIIQCHGDESPEQVLLLKKRVNKKIWKAIRHDEQGIATMKQFRQCADAFVIDARVEGAYGGTGVSFDWNTIPAYLEEAKHQQVPCFIAGGITPQNVGKLRAYGVSHIDVASGIEREGKKEKEAIQQLERMIENDENDLS
ncbi:N-(5'-phosphoribosyl)anthranilate isomerase [Fictibacillus macauensis ZFHKF-1]|uniref:N-(5'-phosphoribosyl)anthranilate isomerase n=1 Tax=Fictibacillus macauensis ZFHKF-1 TaxID=1196324 RepID=I8UI77_9BACL|nr:phosphoribosylanthranilate isomerase [Fictibacillus macauensis]EIT86595.1 N-(5'-phosphoribosyl)anthranilate isomerase [Fictibacillus macauensis ZFHKF-1]